MPIVFDVGLGWITSVLLCSLRLSAMLMMTPILDGFGMPARIRILLVVTLSVCLISSLPMERDAEVADMGRLVVAAAGELVIGGVMGFGVMAAFAVFSFAGNVLDQQLGFGLANVFDPMTRAQSPLIASIFGLLAVLVFFLTDAHHAVLRGFAYSLDKLPLGGGLRTMSVAPLVRQFGLIFSLGLVFAAPVVFCIFLLEVGFAVISRNLPQMNILMITPPLKIVCGLLLLAMLLPLLGPIFSKVFASIFLFWEAVLQ